MASVLISPANESSSYTDLSEFCPDTVHVELLDSKKTITVFI